VIGGKGIPSLELNLKKLATDDKSRHHVTRMSVRGIPVNRGYLGIRKGIQDIKVRILSQVFVFPFGLDPLRSHSTWSVKEHPRPHAPTPRSDVTCLLPCPANKRVRLPSDASRHPNPSPACNLQACLNKNTYAPDKCEDLMRKLYQCCDGMYASNPDAESTACPMRSVTKRWLDRHPEPDSNSQTKK